MPRLFAAATRPALLVLSLLAPARRATRSTDWIEREARLGGAFGDYLAGRFAAQSQDLSTAAADLEAALRDDPGIRELQNQAFIAALLAGRAQATRLAGSLPDNPLAQLVLADSGGKAGRWEAAEARFAALASSRG